MSNLSKVWLLLYPFLTEFLILSQYAQQGPDGIWITSNLAWLIWSPFLIFNATSWPYGLVWAITVAIAVARWIWRARWTKTPFVVGYVVVSLGLIALGVAYYSHLTPPWLRWSVWMIVAQVTSTAILCAAGIFLGTRSKPER